MATILIYEPNEALAQKLCDSLKKEKYDAILCNEHEHTPPITEGEPAPLVILDARIKWTLCRPLMEAFSHFGCPILFVTGNQHMSAHLRALYAAAAADARIGFEASCHYYFTENTFLEKMLNLAELKEKYQ